MYQLSDYYYDLPGDLIAQTPCQNRSRSRLLHVNRNSHRLFHHAFEDIASLLRAGDLLVINNTKVLPARLYGKKETGGKVEILVIDYATGIKNLNQTGFFQCDCLVKASVRPKQGSRFILKDQVAAVVEKNKGDITEIKFLNGRSFLSFLNTVGQMPLPPYIKRQDHAMDAEDEKNYQTVYASKEGAVAAPTAGLHFTGVLMEKLGSKGVGFASVTLHVGYGTFAPVKVTDIRKHRMHSEYYAVSADSAKKINLAKEAGRRIVAVGTTSVRTLEHIADDTGRVKSASGDCGLYIFPGYRFKCVDAMITNFHLPESTLLMLVSAFYDRQRMLSAYQEAVKLKYRFFSYGDAMLIE